MTESELRQLGNGVLFVLRDGEWYARRVLTVTHDLEADHKIYRCDKHLGVGDTFDDCAHAALAATGAPT